MTERKTTYKNITVTIRPPKRIAETIKREKINYLYDLLAGRTPKPQAQKGKK